jgi:hypothetical protein
VLDQFVAAQLGVSLTNHQAAPSFGRFKGQGVVFNIAGVLAVYILVDREILIVGQGVNVYFLCVFLFCLLFVLDL